MSRFRIKKQSLIAVAGIVWLRICSNTCARKTI